MRDWLVELIAFLSIGFIIFIIGLILKFVSSVSGTDDSASEIDNEKQVTDERTNKN